MVSLAPAPATAEVAATYERVSRQFQSTGFSLSTQRQSLEDFCAANDWTVPDHLRFRDGEDADASGADFDLPGLMQVLEHAQRGAFGVLVVPDLDRFARSLVKGLVLEDQLKQYGVRVVYQRVPTDDTLEGTMLKRTLFIFAEYEREKTRLRTMINKRQKALLGQVVGSGPVRYGYAYTHTVRGTRRSASGFRPDPRTAAVVARIFAALLHRSTREVCAELNRDEVPAPRGGAWHPHTLRDIATDATYKGTWTYGKTNTATAPVPVAVPALVDPDAWQRVQDALLSRQKGQVRRPRRGRADDAYLLRGLLVCGVEGCDRALVTRWNNGHRYYGCPRHYRADRAWIDGPTCPLPDVPAEALEEAAWGVVTATALDGRNLRDGLAGARAERESAERARRDRLASFDRQIKQHRERLRRLAGKVADAGGGELGRLLMQQAKEAEALLARFERERGDLVAEPLDGVGEEEVLSLEEFAAEIAEGAEEATGERRRWFYEKLRLRARVVPDPAGVPLGQRHRFRVEWDGRIPVRGTGTGSLKMWCVSQYDGLARSIAVGRSA